MGNQPKVDQSEHVISTYRLGDKEREMLEGLLYVDPVKILSGNIKVPIHLAVILLVALGVYEAFIMAKAMENNLDPGTILGSIGGGAAGIGASLIGKATDKLKFW